MQPYEILITKTEYDKNDENGKNIIVFGPQIIFAFDKEQAVQKATIMSGISPDDVDEMGFYVNKYGLV